MKKKEIKKDPTPYLKKKKAEKQVFTVAENKLLDQMTLEITEAWANDLKKMKEAYETCRKHTEYVKESASDLRRLIINIEHLDDVIKSLFESVATYEEKKPWWKFWS